MWINTKLENGEIVKVFIEREELIYGATAILYSGDFEVGMKAIHPLTKEKIGIIKSNQNRFFIPAHIQKDYEYAKLNNLKTKQVVAPYFCGKGEEKIRNDVKIEERHSVIAVIKHNKEDKYLCVDCKNRECKSFVLGGIEKGETAEQAAVREVKEETGYQNIKINYISPISVYNHFYAGYKGVNRYAILDVLFGEILDEERLELSADESNKHIVKWIKKEELRNFININNNQFAIDILENGDKAWDKVEGKMINSENLNKLDVLEAREYIKKLIGELQNG